MNATSVADINKQVLNLWNTFYNDPKYQEKKTFENALMPQQYPEDLNLKAPVLFIGLNPSFSNERLGHWRRLVQHGPDLTMARGWSDKSDSEKLDEVFEWPNANMDANSKIIALLEKEATRPEGDAEVAKGFRQFEDITGEIVQELNMKSGGTAKWTKRDWMHVDLLFWHETSQKTTLERLGESGSEKLSDFGKKQVELSCAIIRKTRPKIILVANVKSADMLQTYGLDNGLRIDDTSFHAHGFDHLVWADHRAPIFFSSILHGQRALDTKSRRRLMWHMKRALRDVEP